MCNCAGIQTYSNCAGNPDCNCNEGFNNMVGMSGFAGGVNSNATGDIQTLTAPTVGISTTIPTIKVTAPTTTPTASTTPTSGTTLIKVLDIGSGLLGMFTKPAASTSSPVVIPTEEKKIPTAVWVVVGGLFLLVVAFVIVKAKK